MVCRAFCKVLAMALLLSVCLKAEGLPSELVVTDKLGRKVVLEVPVKRAVICITYELIPALDIWDQVVGVSNWAETSSGVYRAFVFGGLRSRKPTVGTGVELNVEKVFKLQPDLVLTWSYDAKAIEFLQKRGLRTIAIWPEDLKELHQTIELHGDLFGKKAASEKTLRAMEELLGLVRARASRAGEEGKKKVLHLGARPTTVSGRLGVIHDVIELIGARNAAAEVKARNAEISLEKMIQWNPDVIFIWGSAHYDESRLYQLPQLRLVKAVKERRVYKLPRWSTWSPRLAALALYMALKTYPEHYRDISFEETVDRFYRKVFGISYEMVKKYEPQ